MTASPLPLTPLAPTTMPSPSNAQAANPQVAQLKAQMADIIEPSAIGFWPLAWGWWVLLSTIIVAIAALTYWLMLRHKANAYRRNALLQLKNLKTFDNQHQQAKTLMVLTKRVALAAFPGERDLINRLTGAAWLQWLNSRTKTPLFNDALAEQWQLNLYRPNGEAADNALTIRCKKWIAEHKQSLSSQTPISADEDVQGANHV